MNIAIEITLNEGDYGTNTIASIKYMVDVDVLDSVQVAGYMRVLHSDLEQFLDIARRRLNQEEKHA